MSNWDQHFIQMALIASSKSQCKRRKVGCIIVLDNRIIATGYNGFIPKAPHESIVRDNHEQATIHAEVNAICDCARRGSQCQNAIAYITSFPCLNCFKTLAAAGIKKIIYLTNYKNDEIVYKLAEQSNIQLQYIQLEEPVFINKSFFDL